MACRDCATGALHGGTPTGRVTELHGLPCYIAEPPKGQEPKGVVVIIPDAFGWELVNNRILADSYAAKGGFRVLLPDFMLGHWLGHDVLYSAEDMLDGEKSWLWARIPGGLRAVINFVPFMFFNRMSVCKPRVYDFFRALRTSTALPIGAAGFCWGGKYVTLLSAGNASDDAKSSDGKALLEAGFVAHPSFLVIPGDIDPISVPYSVAHPTADMNIGPEQAKTFQKALEGKKDVEFVEYEGAKHGFAVRGNPDDEKEKRQGVEAEDQAVRWFQKYLVAGRSKL